MTSLEDLIAENSIEEFLTEVASIYEDLAKGYEAGLDSGVLDDPKDQET